MSCRPQQVREFLQNESNKKDFLEYMKTLYNNEVLECWDLCQKYLATSNASTRADYLKQLKTVYLTEGHQKEVNITGKTRSDIVAGIDAGGMSFYPLYIT
eukprot:TRINITY_DN6790_c3_g1_i1.p1 TRINITY_DN6790_c3_g1~~TRINITY_DN6790_c3_g1_i1.p1  ORF type:complete len:100 (-),score=18.27 TRINITY_DN6790_c3_g1_i1:362-661(-)